MKKLKITLVVFGALTALTAPAFSVEYFLRADVTTLTVPDANGVPMNIPMWGFALENSTFTAGTAAKVPGPMLTVPPGDPNLIIHLKNNLTAANIGLSIGCPVSIVIPGQVTPMTPVRFGPTPYPQYEGRIRSLTHETPPDNTTVVNYVWNNVRPGSYVYHSGTHIQCHVQMGLYGGVIKDYALSPYKQAYQNIVYDVNVPLFFSEIDPEFHLAVDSNNYGPGKLMSSTIDYKPKYFLINGVPYDPNDPNQIIPSGSSGGGTLLRLFNMGLQSRSVLLQGSYMSLVAEDGQPYKYPKEQYAALLPAGKTLDAMVAFPAAGTYPVYDRRLGLTNDRLTGGGMLRYLSVVSGNAWPVITSVTATPASITDSQTSQLLVSAVDADPLTYSWAIPAGAGSLDSTTIANPVFTPAFIAGTQTYTFTVTVSDGVHVDIGTVNVTVTGVVNAAPVITSVTADPNSILDTQTSQLQVTATDTDGPSPLSYNWIVPAGGGSVSNAAIANPVYTPPDVATTQVYTLTVQVSDGLTPVNGTVSVTVNNTVVNAAPVITSVTADPNSILDTQTSQLQVNATDDGLPNPPAALSYNWIVPAGAGSVSNVAIANPVYTPPDVASTQVYTLTVQVSDGALTTSSTVNVTVNDDLLIFSANFNTNTDGFAYADDTFRGTNSPAGASGSRVATGGFTGGALRVLLGAVNNTNFLNGMSGGWSRTFNLEAAGIVNVTFRYNLAQSPHYENDEFSDMMLSIDNILKGTNPNDYIARITGNGNGGGNITTEWQLFTVSVNLSAGNHSITIGGYNNKKDANNERTTILIDDVVLTRE